MFQGRRFLKDMFAMFLKADLSVSPAMMELFEKKEKTVEEEDQILGAMSAALAEAKAKAEAEETAIAGII